MVYKEEIKLSFEKRIQELKESLWKSYSVEKEARLSECERMLTIINAIKEEFTSDELTSEIQRWREHYIKVKEYGLQIDLRDVEAIANHFANWQKQQMKKDAVETIVKGYVNGKGIYIETDIPFGIDVNESDKVKLIIIKEE